MDIIEAATQITLKAIEHDLIRTSTANRSDENDLERANRFNSAQVSAFYEAIYNKLNDTI